METNAYMSDLAIHPGELLEETIEEIGMSQVELANRLGRPTQTINEIIKGKKSITPATAIELEDVLKVPAHIWIGLETEYQMIKAKQEELKEMKEEIPLLERFPYLDLSKHGFVERTRDPIKKVDELRSFFAVAQLHRIKHVEAYQSAFRVTNHKNITHESIASWIQAGRLEANKIKTKPFHKTTLKKLLPKIKESMLLKNMTETITACKELLASCGVAFVLIPHFKNTGAQGATFWLNNKDKAVLMMSLRGKYTDRFWFSFFHEIGHILLHKKREIFIENGYDTPQLRQQEEEANRFAKEFLIPQKKFEVFIADKNYKNKEVVRAFATSLHIRPSIVVGRLMHERLIAYHHPLRNELDTYEF